MRDLLKAANRELEKARKASEAGDTARATEHMDKHEELMGQFRQQETLAQREAETQRLLDQSRERQEIRAGTNALITTPDEYNARQRVIRRFSRHGRSALNDAEWALMNRLTERDQAWWDYMGADPEDQLGVRQAKQRLIQVAEAEVRALSTSGGVGGETIPEGFQATIYAEMEAYGPMAEAGLSERIVTAGGEDIPMPTVTNVAKFDVVGEGQQIPDQEPGTDSVTLGAYKYGGKQTLSYELLQDTGVDLEGFIGRFAAEGLGRGLNEDFTIGRSGATGHATNANQATGLLAVPAAHRVRTENNDGRITAVDMEAMIHGLDPAYRSMAVILVNDDTVRVLKLLQTEGNYLWRPFGGGEATFANRPPDTWDGYPLRVNQAVPKVNPTAGSGNTNVTDIGIFYHTRSYATRLAGPYRIKRGDEVLMEKDQVLFTHLQRADGKIIRANGISVLTRAAGS